MDFSKRILTTCPANLAILSLNGIEWSDLGAPSRVMATLTRSGARPGWVETRATA